MGEGYPGGNTNLRGCPDGFSRMTVGLVKIPQPERPLLEGVRGQPPILILDHLPDLMRQAGLRHRLALPVFLDLFLPAGPQRLVGPLVIVEALADLLSLLPVLSEDLLAHTRSEEH